MTRRVFVQDGWKVEANGGFKNLFAFLEEDEKTMNESAAYQLGAILARRNPVGLTDHSDVAMVLVQEGHEARQEQCADFLRGWRAAGGRPPLLDL